MLLDTQYRMHPAISAFPSFWFYKARLRNGVTAAEKPIPLVCWNGRLIGIKKQCGGDLVKWIVGSETEGDNCSASRHRAISLNHAQNRAEACRSLQRQAILLCSLGSVYLNLIYRFQ